MAIFTSTLANFIVLMDLSNYSIHKVELTTADDPTSNHGRGAKRSIAWAVGSNYVWVDANALSQQYVIELDSGGDITKAKVVKTLDELPSRTMLYVENYMASNIDSLPATLSAKSSGTKSETTVDNNIGIAALVIGCVGSVLGLFSLILIMKNK